ncbi:MAG: hypothetical protein LBP63_06990 [Prevotellaceae bacterium]|nr:hypothetical protein [Prevotellaceae bacterium]
MTVESYFFTIYYSGLVGYAEPFGFRSYAPRKDEPTTQRVLASVTKQPKRSSA